ncbi:hypothetical protein B7494_g6672 [Chlorociboria aeruginascens]|nr:hypothetical protein B7494_g6672 [Chlorociboria aeruginascens]
MNPHQRNKIDISSLSPDEQRLFRLYGKVPSRTDHLAKIKERKYFDSGDYALSKAGKASSLDTGNVGSQHPLPENIPHLSSPGVGNANQGGSGNGNIHSGVTGGTQSGSPVKESSFLNRGTSVDELEDKEALDDGKDDDESPPPAKEGIPIGR